MKKKFFLYGKRSIILKNYFAENNFFYREKKWKCKKYHISEIYFYTENVCVTKKSMGVFILSNFEGGRLGT